MNYPWLFCPSDNWEHRLALPTPRCAHFYTYIGCVIQEGVKSLEKCAQNSLFKQLKLKLKGTVSRK